MTTLEKIRDAWKALDDLRESSDPVGLNLITTLDCVLDVLRSYEVARTEIIPPTLSREQLPVDSMKEVQLKQEQHRLTELHKLGHLTAADARKLIEVRACLVVIAQAIEGEK